MTVTLETPTARPTGAPALTYPERTLIAGDLDAQSSAIRPATRTRPAGNGSRDHAPPTPHSVSLTATRARPTC